MIEEDTLSKSIPLPKKISNRQEPPTPTIKDQLVNYVIKYLIEPGSFLKLTTSIPNFRPIYFYTMEFRPVENQDPNKRNSSSAGEHIFKYGSQVYLRMKTGPTKTKSRFKQQQSCYNFTIEQIEQLKTSLFGNTRLFFQILIRNQYLTRKQEKEIILSNESSNQSIWVIEEEKYGNDHTVYRLFNISNNSYLSLSSARGRDHQIAFTLVDDRGSNTLFYIQTSQESSQYFVMRPVNQSPKKGSKKAVQQGLQIQIVAVQNSVTNLFYQLKYATEIITNSPSIPILHEIIQQLIYYNISEFGQNQQLLSVPIQKLLAEVGISQALYQYITQIFNKLGYDAELADFIENNVRLLCLGSYDNSNIFVHLVSKLLDSYDYKPYLVTLRKLIHCNTFLINKFQSFGWSQIILRKLDLTFSTGEFSTFHSLLQLASEFCYGTHSIPNKYLIMHTLQRIFDENYSQNTEEQNLLFNFWIRLFQEGQYVFVQVEKDGKYSQIELQNYLEMDDGNKEVYLGQIQMIGAICSGFNINGINRFYHLLKAVSSYCYNETYPFFKHPQCKQITIEAIVTSFDWGQTSQKLQNKYNIGYVFTDSQGEQSKSSKIKDKNAPKYKIEPIKNIKFNSRQNETITDVLRHFLLAFQEHMISFFNESKQKNKPIIELILSRDKIQDKLGSNLGNWIKLISIALDARLITMLKKKAGPYTQYFKKILQPSKKSSQKQPKSKQKSFSPEKKNRNRRYSASNFPFSLDKEYQTQINIILQLITKIISYNPLYELYLEQRRITNLKNSESTSNFVQKMIINIRRSNLPYRNSKSKKYKLENKYEAEDYNKIMYMEELLHEKEQMEYVEEVKVHCYRVLSLIYQNIIEEQIQYQIKNLGYSVQGPIKFTSKLTFAEGFKKFPFVDDQFRLSLLQNWYMASKPSTLDQVTTLMRYIYDQNQIHIRAINTTMALFTKQSLQLYQAIQLPMSQLQRLTQCLPTWYQPQILKASAAYEQNYNMLLRCLQAVNTEVRKSTQNNMSLLVLVDYQQMLQNLGVIDVVKCLIFHLSQLETYNKKMKTNKKNIEYKDIRKQADLIYSQLSKLILFYIQFSQQNRAKLLICLDQCLTSSPKNQQLLTLILTQPPSTTSSSTHNLLNKSMIKNLVQMLPESTQALQVVLDVQGICFMQLLEYLGICLEESEEYGGMYSGDDDRKLGEFMEERIVAHVGCFRLFCRIAYRVMALCRYGHRFLQWFFDRLVWYYIQRQLSTNTHFKKKQIESISTVTIQQNSSISYLLYHLFTRAQQSQQSQQCQYYKNYKITSASGQKLVIDYIMTEVLATCLDNDTNPIMNYIDYYVWDLLPLLGVFDQLLDLEEVAKAILDRINRYMTIYENAEGAQNQDQLPATGQEQISMVAGVSTKRRQLQKFITQGKKPKNFEPRSSTLFWKKIQYEKPMIPESQPEQQDPFEKISKKAMKSWFKARLILNENKQSYISRDRWVLDLMKLQKQCQGEEWQKEIIINSSDIISKTVSILMNSDYVLLSPENQIFLLKNFLFWLSEQIQTTQKTTKKSIKLPQSNPIFLIKRIQTKQILLNILEKAQQKLLNQHSRKNIAICYQLKIAYYLISLISNLQQKTKQKIVAKVVAILHQLLDCYHLHGEILQQYQQAKTIDYWPGVMTIWIPIGLLSQFVIKFLQLAEITVDQFQMLSENYLKARIRLKNIKSEPLNILINRVLSTLKQMSPDDFRRQEQKVMLDPFYEVLNRIL